MPGFNQQDGQQLTPDVIARRLNALEGVPRPYILAQSGVPLILPSSGSSNASGQITLTTALPYQPVGVVQIYLPAAVVVGDATGGMKSVIFSSTTVCQIVGNPVTANGAYTQTTGADLTLSANTVPGGSMGANGALRYFAKWSFLNNANNKSTKQNMGGQVIGANSNAGTVSLIEPHVLQNRGTQAAQIGGYFGFQATVGANNNAGMGKYTIDTSTNQPFLQTGQLAVATDYLILEGFIIEILPAN